MKRFFILMLGVAALAILAYSEASAQEYNASEDSTSWQNLNTARRMEILKWIEEYKSLYEKKDIKALKRIFESSLPQLSDKETGSDNDGTQAVNQRMKGADYTRLFTKNLDKLLGSVENVKIDLEYVAVYPHYARPDMYGVNLHQKVMANGYDESSWLFLLWDYTNPEKPYILICTLQSDEMVAEDGVITIDDIFIP